MKKLSIIGTVAFDSLKSPFGERKRVLGGSASFAAVAASFFNETHIISIVGSDFDSNYFEFFADRNIDTSGIKISSGDTFHWSGYYEKDMSQAYTLQTDLNVLLEFDPKVPDSCKESELVFCGNIDPVLQKKALLQFNNPELIILDTMNYWIENSRAALLEVLTLVDILIINDSEAKLLTGETTVITALDALLRLGPKRVIVKKGEHGSMMSDGNELCVCSAMPTRNVVDPTGAGDSFAGAFAGFLSTCSDRSDQTFRKALAYGSIVSSYTVQGFSMEGINKLSRDVLEEQYGNLQRLSSI
jgi:sugar/nucleoside kinase (ribokinase family)